MKFSKQLAAVAERAARYDTADAAYIAAQRDATIPHAIADEFFRLFAGTPTTPMFEAFREFWRVARAKGYEVA